MALELKPAQPPRFLSLVIRDRRIVETGQPATRERVEELMRPSEGFMIAVWNCRAELRRVSHSPGAWGLRDVCWDPPLTRRQGLRLRETLEAEVWRQGGAVNISGHYQISAEALGWIARLIGQRRLKRTLQAMGGG